MSDRFVTHWLGAQLLSWRAPSQVRLAEPGGFANEKDRGLGLGIHSLQFMAIVCSQLEAQSAGSGYYFLYGFV